MPLVQVVVIGFGDSGVAVTINVAGHMLMLALLWS